MPEYIPEMDLETDDTRWRWMMEYCLSHGIPPQQDWAWKRARGAYNKAKGGE